MYSLPKTGPGAAVSLAALLAAAVLLLGKKAYQTAVALVRK